MATTQPSTGSDPTTAGESSANASRPTTAASSAKASKSTTAASSAYASKSTTPPSDPNMAARAAMARSLEALGERNMGTAPYATLMVVLLLCLVAVFFVVSKNRGQKTHRQSIQRRRSRAPSKVAPVIEVNIASSNDSLPERELPKGRNEAITRSSRQWQGESKTAVRSYSVIPVHDSNVDNVAESAAWWTSGQWKQRASGRRSEPHSYSSPELSTSSLPRRHRSGVARRPSVRPGLSDLEEEYSESSPVLSASASPHQGPCDSQPASAAEAGPLEENSWGIREIGELRSSELYRTQSSPTGTIVSSESNPRLVSSEAPVHR